MSDFTQFDEAFLQVLASLQDDPTIKLFDDYILAIPVHTLEQATHLEIHCNTVPALKSAKRSQKSFFAVLPNLVTFRIVFHGVKKLAKNRQGEYMPEPS